MKRLVKVALFVAAISLMLAGVAQQPSGPAGSGEQGKNIFVSRCAKCHDADASRKLPDGTDLLGRLAKSPDPKTLLATRLKDQRERDVVMVYLQPLIERSRAAGPGAHAVVTPANPQRPR
jgi:mono/diheme cytochrome c family protein